MTHYTKGFFKFLYYLMGEQSSGLGSIVCIAPAKRKQAGTVCHIQFLACSIIATRTSAGQFLLGHLLYNDKMSEILRKIYTFFLPSLFIKFTDTSLGTVILS